MLSGLNPTSDMLESLSSQMTRQPTKTQGSTRFHVNLEYLSSLPILLFCAYVLGCNEAQRRLSSLWHITMIERDATKTRYTGPSKALLLSLIIDCPPGLWAVFIKVTQGISASTVTGALWCLMMTCISALTRLWRPDLLLAYLLRLCWNRVR